MGLCDWKHLGKRNVREGQSCVDSRRFDLLLQRLEVVDTINDHHCVVKHSLTDNPNILSGATVLNFVKSPLLVFCSNLALASGYDDAGVAMGFRLVNGFAVGL